MKHQINPCVVSFSGYMAPEYAIDGLFSIKSDVFGFESCSTNEVTVSLLNAR